MIIASEIISNVVTQYLGDKWFQALFQAGGKKIKSLQVCHQIVKEWQTIKKNALLNFLLDKKKCY